MIGGKPTLHQRIQAALGEFFWRAGCRLRWPWLSRLGWDLQTLSWGKGHICKCGKRSRTEREHLKHACFALPFNKRDFGA